MSAQPAPNGAAAPTADRFAWHPTYRGKTLAEVQGAIQQELARDQRAYALLLDGAEKEENAALASVLELEKKWGAFDFGWAETDPADLAARVAAFERARDQRRELFPYAAYRDEIAPAPAVRPGRSSFAGRPAFPVGGRPPLLWLAVAVAVLLILVLLLVT